MEGGHDAGYGAQGRPDKLTDRAPVEWHDTHLLAIIEEFCKLRHHAQINSTCQSQTRARWLGRARGGRLDLAVMRTTPAAPRLESVATNRRSASGKYSA